MKPAWFVVLAAFCAACATPARGSYFEASGPEYLLTIDQDQMMLTLTQTGDRIIFPAVEPRYPRWNGEIHETRNASFRLSVQIRDDRPCQSSHRAIYPITVELRLGNRELHGCGRRIAARR